MNNKTILLVEDEKITSIIFTKILEQQGVKVIQAVSGEEAILIVDSTPGIDLILMDIDLGPGIYGTEAAKIILKNHDIPIVFLSSHTELEIVEKTEGITSYGYVVKNSGETVLLASIQMAFRLCEANKQIYENETKQRTMLSNISDVISIIDHDGINRYTSSNVEKWFGWKPEQLTGKSILDTLHPDDLDSVMNCLKKLSAQNGTAAEIECRCLCSDGSYKMVEVTVVNLLNDRSINGYLVNYHDISEKTRKDKVLHDHKEMLSMILNNIPQSVFWKDAEGKYLGCNRVFAETIGLDSPEMIKGLTDYDLPWPGEEADAYRSDDRQVIESNIQKLNIVEPLQKPDGTRLWVDTSKIPLRDKTGKPFGVLGIYDDITHRRIAEHEIKTRLSEKETLLKEVIHRIKNNMASVESLLTMKAESAVNSEAVYDIKDAIARVQGIRLIYDKLLLVGDYRDIPVKFFLSDLISTVVNIFPNRDQVTIEQNIDDIILDVKRLQPLGMIVNELITDAMKYAFKGRDTGIIYFSLLKDKNKIKLTVRDNGIGLPPGFNYTETKGLGLTLVSMLSEQLGGSFSIKNDNGTVSEVKFDLVQNDSVKSGRIRSAEGKGSGKADIQKPVILIVDDLPLNRVLIKYNIMKLLPDAKIIEASDGREAFELFKIHKADIVFMDIQMPVMDGIESAKKIRKYQKCSNTAVIIAFSADDSHIDREKCFMAGMNDVLVKPVDGVKVKDVFLKYLPDPLTAD
jgi:PAS domain S-box-containing protein